MAYHFRSAQFEGPLDLLLGLIEKEKLDITQVSLAQVADQYLAYMQEEETLSLENMAAFLGVAARLILIKSRALLPVLDFSDEEEVAMDDLEKQLQVYRRFREASLQLGHLFTESHASATRESFLGLPTVFYPPKDISVEVLHSHFVAVLGDIPVFEVLPEKAMQAVITLEEKITSLQETLRERVHCTFAEIIHSAAGKVEVIVSFLAMLELIKQRFIGVEQEKYFSEITLKRLV